MLAMLAAVTGRDAGGKMSRTDYRFLVVVYYFALLVPWGLLRDFFMIYAKVGIVQLVDCAPDA